MKFNLKRIKRMIPKKYVKMYEANKSKLPAALMMLIVLVGLVSKNPTHAGSTEKGIFGGALTGAAIGGIAGGGRGAGIGALTGAALGGIIGSSKDSSNRDPREKRLNKLYKQQNRAEKRMLKAKTDQSRAKYEREMKEIGREIDSLQDSIYGGRGSATYRPGGYAAPNRYRY